MPVRLVNRNQTWLLPPSLDELVSRSHPVRFVAEVIDSMEPSEWTELGIDTAGDPLGAPSYDRRGLLGIWTYGFMTGLWSSRKLEAACRDQLAFVWLTGWQQPDHNTLWRFYQAHRDRMRRLLKRTVRMALEMGLVSMAIQAVDGTKVAANADKGRTYDADGLKKFLQRVEDRIRELEHENEAENDPPPQQLPDELTKAESLKAKVKAAMKRLAAEEGRKRINLTDGDAELMKSRHGIVAGYNAQAVVTPVASLQDERESGHEESGLLITAAEVVTEPVDTDQLVPMLEQAEQNAGKRADILVADAGYHSGENLESLGDRIVAMPEAQDRALRNPYHKDRFSHDQETDSYICPHGQRLLFRRIKLTKGTTVREYRAAGDICRDCPAFGTCTSNGTWGRRIEIRPHDPALRRHRSWMATEQAKAAYSQRKELVEPVFGILKEQMGLRRFLLRGLAKVRTEFAMLAAAFNLRTLWKFWKKRGSISDTGVPKGKDATKLARQLCSQRSKQSGMPAIDIISLSSHRFAIGALA